MFSIERKAYCVYKEFYSVTINDEYVKNINDWLRKSYPNVQVEDITEQDIKDYYNQEENQKLETKLSEYSTLGSFIKDYVEDDIWDSCYDTQYDYMEDYDTYIEEGYVSEVKD